jgi:hypothetical protein
LFSDPVFKFPAKKSAPSSFELKTFPGLLQPTDIITDAAVVSGTTYRNSQILVLEVSSSDVLKVGVILHLVIRAERLHFIVNIHDAVRTSFGFFPSLSM